ncbi:MAG: hypothetical protein KF830_05730 [Planctomycetes bacterium]|nr:hypothetical protein [Planctomycetota bacterium]
MRSPAVSVSLAALLATATAASQDWTGDELAAACPGFQSEDLGARLEQTGKLVANRDRAFTAMVAMLHGDHREYRLKIDHLLDQLADPSWQAREQAERTLIEIGGRAVASIEQRKERPAVLEQQIRCARILEALAAKGTEQEDRERRLLRGLATTALHLEPEPRLLRALRSALGHTDATITASALRALGKLGGDDEADAVAQMVVYKAGVHRLTAVAALGRMRSDRALGSCRELLWPPAQGGRFAGTKLNRTESIAIVRGMHARSDAGAAALLADLKNHPDPVVAAAAGIRAPNVGGATVAKFQLPDRRQVEGRFGGLYGDSQLLVGAFAHLPTAELAFHECDTIDFPGHAAEPQQGVRLFLNQGSLVIGDLLGIDGEQVRLRSPVFGDLALPRAAIQGLALDPALDRLVGASVEHDRVRLRSGQFAEGRLLAAAAGKLTIDLRDGGRQELPIAEVAGILFVRPPASEPDQTAYTRVDLVTGERLIGFVADTSPDHLAVCVPLLGAAALPLTKVTHIELEVGGGAMWGFTLIADYSDNRILEVDDQGRVVFVLEDVFGAWDAECLDNGNLLITEFYVSRVQEVTRKGEVVWVFEDLKNPYDADRLPNGNTLIADTFGSRVIEVDRTGAIVWSYAKEIRPFDVDRLPNGNTLIADLLKDRVLEVDPGGEIVWEVRSLPNAHDADRLPNGNTLVTLRNKGTVIEIDRDGKVVWELTGLNSPSDADRLPNGNTLVAENNRVREFDRRGNEVWRKDVTWAVEANRY